MAISSFLAAGCAPCPGAAGSQKGVQMLRPNQNREKASEYERRQKDAGNPDEPSAFQKLAQNYNTLADNEEWLADNASGIMRSTDLKLGNTHVQEDALPPARLHSLVNLEHMLAKITRHFRQILFAPAAGDRR